MISNESGAAIRTLRTGLARFAGALRAFLSGFVGETALPRDRDAARHALEHRANGRGRCC